MSGKRSSPSFELVRVKRPGSEMLQMLEMYDREAFGDTGLGIYDLAVMAEAGAIYLALIEGEVAAGCQLIRVLDEPDLFYVVGFYVRSPWRAKGLGKQFMDAVAEAAQESGAAGLALTVAPGNTWARRLYESAGFEEDAFVPHFYGEGEDRYLLRRRFDRGGLAGQCMIEGQRRR